jgi:GlpG protein
MHYQDDNGPPLFTYCVLACYLAVFSAQWTSSDLAFLWPFTWALGKGELWRLITATALHGGVLHLAFNAYLFVRFSSVVENWLGPWISVLLYALWASAAMAAQLLWNPAPPIGASGVVYAYFGFLWVMRRRRDDAALAANSYLIETLLAWLGICAVINFFGGNIANTAHVWGLAAGWLTGQCFVARRRWRAALIAGTLLACVVPVALLYGPVWNVTLRHVPRLSQYNPQPWPDAVRLQFERAVMRPPGLFM